MNRLFWLSLGAIIAGVIVWAVARNQMDDLYAEISRMREEQREQTAA
ncbi:MAG: cbb3-type cytochrome oxidase assembly protein CcoS [Chloroflexota bacterium]